MLSKELNIGRAGQHLVLADLLMRGLQAYGTAEGCAYDVLLDLNGRLIKIQVKSTLKMRVGTQRTNPIYFFHTKRTGKGGLKHYKEGDFDCYALVALDKREVFYVDYKSGSQRHSICIRDRALDYSGHKGGGRKGIYYQDLTFENFLKLIAE